MEQIKEQLTTHQTSLYNMLLKQLYYNYEIQPTYKQFLINHYSDIIELINNYKKWSPNTKQSIFFMLSKVYKLLNKENVAKETSQEGFKLKQQIEEDKAQNIMTNKEAFSYIPHEELISLFNELEFNKDNHYKKLLLGLVLLQPPLRSNFYITCQIIDNILLNNGVDNYLLINDKDCYYIVNNDKISKHANRNKLIHIKNKKLINLLKQSIKYFPRVYLLETKKGGKLTEEQLLKLLRSTTHQPLINISMMRSNYITWYYQHNPSLKAREELADQMRHQASTGHLNYNKVEPIEEELKQIKQKMALFFEDKDNEKKYNKQRKDILYSLLKFQNEPTTKSILKYNLQKVDNVWI